MSCWCGADYDDAGQCPRCSGFALGSVGSDEDTPLGLFDLPPFDVPGVPAPDLHMPELPDGPDEMLMRLAEMEAAVARERAALDESNGARRCRFCRGAVPAGTDSGVHDACWPRELPEGARSCSGCGECILDDDDDFEHDFCPYPGEAEASADELDPLTEDDDAPTEPMATEPPLRHEDSIQCTCGRWHPYLLIAPFDGMDTGAVSSTALSCPCRTLIAISYSWARRCVTSVRFERPASPLN